MKLIQMLLIFILMSCASSKNSKSDGNFTYQVEGVEHTGYIKSGVSKGEKAPAVIVVHEWWGHNDYARSRVDQLANLGYVALSIDMYGEGKQAEHPKDAGAFAAKALSDFDLAKERFTKAIEILRKRKDVDSNKISAIGYCFGGGVVLNMARSGVDLELIASFHGALKSDKSFQNSSFSGKVLVFNGAKDPMVKAEDIKNFKSDIEKAGIEYSFVNYKDAVHAFTNEKASEIGKKYNLPLAYDRAADKDSWSKFVAELAKLK